MAYRLKSSPISDRNMSARSSRQSANKVELHYLSVLHTTTKQIMSLAERTIGTCKALLTRHWKVMNALIYTALWMYRTTPLDNQMPSPYELLFGRRPQTMLPSTRSVLKSQHPQDDAHQEANQQRQAKQAQFYDKKASSDKRILENMDVSVRKKHFKEHMGTSSHIKLTTTHPATKNLPSRHPWQDISKDKRTSEAQEYR
jgi:hypothetical protein